MSGRRNLVLVAVVGTGAFIAGLLGFVARGAPPTVTRETQAWWRLAGITIPSAVGEHVHARYTIPADGFPVDGKIIIPVDVTEHAGAGPTTFVRVQSVSPSGSIVERAKVPLSLGPCTDCTAHVDVTVDLAQWATGRNEVRITANIARNHEGNRQYQSTGEQICVRSCSPTYRSGPWVEGRGWYTGRGYQNARLTSALDTVRSGGTVKVKLDHGSGGLTTTFSGAYIDPDFHHGLAGQVIRTGNGPFSGSLTLPTLAAGPHKLVLLASDGKNAGVLAIPFVTP